MCNSNVPSETNVIHLVYNERSINYRWFPDSCKLDKHLCIYSIDKVGELREKGFKLPDSIRENDVLIRSPFRENTFYSVKEANKRIAIDKFNVISRIAQYLGAMSYEIVSCVHQSGERSWGVNGDVCYKGVETKSGIETNEKFVNEYNVQLKDEFEGIHRLSDDDFQRAREEVEKYNFQWMDALLHARDPKQSNSITHREIQCSLSEEIESSLDVAFSLCACGGIFAIGGSVHKAIQTYHKWEVKIDFRFP